jgi:hypothetical protein
VDENAANGLRRCAARRLSAVAFVTVELPAFVIDDAPN